MLHETNEVRTPRPTQSKDNQLKAAEIVLVTFFFVGWVSSGVMAFAPQGQGQPNPRNNSYKRRKSYL